MSSTKVIFDVDTLHEKVVTYHEEQLRKAQEAYAGIPSAEDLAEEQRQWREFTEAKVSDIFRRLGDDEPKLSNRALQKALKDLAKNEYPEGNFYERSSLKRAVERSEATLARVKVKFESLRRNEDGTIHLTAAQLRDFFSITDE